MVLQVGVGARPEQQRHGRRLLMLHREVQRGVAGAVCEVNPPPGVGDRPQQRLQQLCAALSASQVVPQAAPLQVPRPCQPLILCQQRQQAPLILCCDGLLRPAQHEQGIDLAQVPLVQPGSSGEDRLRRSLVAPAHDLPHLLWARKLVHAVKEESIGEGIVAGVGVAALRAAQRVAGQAQNQTNRSQQWTGSSSTSDSSNTCMAATRRAVPRPTRLQQQRLHKCTAGASSTHCRCT